MITKPKQLDESSSAEDVFIYFMANAGCLDEGDDDITERRDEPWFKEAINAMEKYAYLQVSKQRDIMSRHLNMRNVPRPKY